MNDLIASSRPSPGARFPPGTSTALDPTSAASFAETALSEPFVTAARTWTTPFSMSAHVSSLSTAGQPERRSFTESVMP